MSVFQILIDRLKGGISQKIDLDIAPSFLGPEEAELKFDKNVVVKGETYLTDEHLIIHLKANTAVKMPCAICNQMTGIELKIDDFYHVEPIEDIKGAIFDFSNALREALLIELPRTVECNSGKCKERETLLPYMKSEKKQDRTHFPFAEMDKDLN